MHIRILRMDNFIKSLLWHYAGNFFLPMWRNPNSGVPKIFACGIRNPEMFSCKSGILAFWRVWNTAQGIRNPTNHWNQESQFHWQESGIQSLESGIRSLESTVQDCLWFPYLPIGLNPLGCVFPLTGQEIWKRSFFDEKGKQIQVDHWSNQKRGHLCLFWQLKISSVLIPGWQRFDSFVRRMRCIFPLSNLKRLIHLYDSVELTTSQRPSLSIEHSFGDAIYPFMVAKKRIFRAYASQVGVWSIWKHC